MLSKKQCSLPVITTMAYIYIYIIYIYIIYILYIYNIYMCVSVCVCVFIFVYICIYICIYIYIHICIIYKTCSIDECEIPNVINMPDHLSTIMSDTSIQTKKSKRQWNLMSSPTPRAFPTVLNVKSSNQILWQSTVKPYLYKMFLF